MIANEINDFINKIMEKTEKNELNWQYAEYLLARSSNWSSMPKAVKSIVDYCMNDNTGVSMYANDSFYLRNDDRYLFLLHLAKEPTRGKVVQDWWCLFAVLGSDYEAFVPIPDYHPANESDRLKKISDLIKKNKDAEQEQSDKRLLEFFDSFL